LDLDAEAGFVCLLLVNLDCSDGLEYPRNPFDSCFSLASSVLTEATEAAPALTGQNNGRTDCASDTMACPEDSFDSAFNSFLASTPTGMLQSVP
jgi:hypothetical protein